MPLSSAMWAAPHSIERSKCHRWAQNGSFSAYDECKLWAWTVFGAGVLGLPATVKTGSNQTTSCKEASWQVSEGEHPY